MPRQLSMPQPTAAHGNGSSQMSPVAEEHEVPDLPSGPSDADAVAHAEMEDEQLSEDLSLPAEAPWRKQQLHIEAGAGQQRVFPQVQSSAQEAIEGAGMADTADALHGSSPFADWMHNPASASAAPAIDDASFNDHAGQQAAISSMPHTSAPAMRQQQLDLQSGRLALHTSKRGKGTLLNPATGTPVARKVHSSVGMSILIAAYGSGSDSDEPSQRSGGSGSPAAVAELAEVQQDGSQVQLTNIAEAGDGQVSVTFCKLCKIRLSNLHGIHVR